MGANLGDHILAAGINQMGGAELAGDCQPLLHEVDAEQRIGPDKAAELQR